MEKDAFWYDIGGQFPNELFAVGEAEGILGLQGEMVGFGSYQVRRLYMISPSLTSTTTKPREGWTMTKSASPIWD
ncbi:MAG: hypothetical protein WAR00_08285 [bacterium]|jgi:hypothetical protein